MPISCKAFDNILSRVGLYFLTKLTVSMILSALNFHFYSDSHVPWNKRLLCRYRKFDVQVICPQPHMSFHLQHLSETCMLLSKCIRI